MRKHRHTHTHRNTNKKQTYWSEICFEAKLVLMNIIFGFGVKTQKRPHLSHQLAAVVHAQVEVGLFASDSHLAAKGVCFHYELGL